MKKKIIRFLAAILCIVLSLGIIGGGTVLSINEYIKYTAGKNILTPEEAAKLTDVDCILVLGCGVWDDGRPSHMLEDRLKMSVALYELGVSDKLLMTGDHGRVNYDEVAVMKGYAVDAGIASQAVFMDHAGFSTYESLYRAKEIFCAKKIVIVTQGYHLYRAIFIAQSLGLEAYGVASDYRTYTGQQARNLREVLARVKDAAYCLLKPEPTYLGEQIPIWGDGNLTNDENSDFT